MFWWAFGALVAFVVLRQCWLAYVHPAMVLVRQAAHMNWVAAGCERDAEGYRDTLVARGGLLASISFMRRHVELRRPSVSTPFKDFIQIERWIASDEGREALEQMSARTNKAELMNRIVSEIMGVDTEEWRYRKSSE